MIIFDGVDMQSVANVKIEDVRVSSIQYAPLARARSSSAGSVFVRNRPGTRTVAVTFALLKQERVSRQAALSAISAWAKTDKEYKLELPGHPDRFLTATCTAKPDPSLRQWWEAKLKIVFTCYNDPFWNDNVEKSAACGTEFFVLGDAPPKMRIERTLAAAASNQSYTMDGKTITFSTIPQGDMVIDLDAETATVDGVGIMQYYAMTSRWPELHPGTNEVTGTGTVKYRERWS